MLDELKALLLLNCLECFLDDWLPGGSRFLTVMNPCLGGWGHARVYTEFYLTVDSNTSPTTPTAADPERESAARRSKRFNGSRRLTPSRGPRRIRHLVERDQELASPFFQVMACNIQGRCPLHTVVSCGNLKVPIELDQTNAIPSNPSAGGT